MPVSNPLQKQRHQLWIDLLIQDHRRTEDKEKWHILDNYILYEWLESSLLFGKIYKTYNSQLLSDAITDAKLENYSLVITLGDLRSQNYSALAREIAQDNIALGIDIRTTIFHRQHKKDLQKLDNKIIDNNDKSKHISQKFAYWFTQVFNLNFDQQDLYPTIDIPDYWQKNIDLRLKQWKQEYPTAPSIFINIYAKGNERCWSPEQAICLIQSLQSQPKYKNALFILNSPPEAFDQLNGIIHTQKLNNTISFGANESFFELPALLKKMNIIITVDTSIMHLACISDAYLISLIRKKSKKDIRWTPLKAINSTIIYTPNSNDPISAITPKDVLKVIQKIPQ